MSLSTVFLIHLIIVAGQFSTTVIGATALR
jgi:hypothetical protein